MPSAVRRRRRLEKRVEDKPTPTRGEGITLLDKLGPQQLAYGCHHTQYQWQPNHHLVCHFAKWRLETPADTSEEEEATRAGTPGKYHQAVQNARRLRKTKRRRFARPKFLPVGGKSTVEYPCLCKDASNGHAALCPHAGIVLPPTSSLPEPPPPPRAEPWDHVDIPWSATQDEFSFTSPSTTGVGQGVPVTSSAVYPFRSPARGHRPSIVPDSSSSDDEEEGVSLTLQIPEPTPAPTQLFSEVLRLIDASSHQSTLRTPVLDELTPPLVNFSVTSGGASLDEPSPPLEEPPPLNPPLPSPFPTPSLRASPIPNRRSPSPACSLAPSSSDESSRMSMQEMVVVPNFRAQTSHSAARRRRFTEKMRKEQEDDRKRQKQELKLSQHIERLVRQGRQSTLRGKSPGGNPTSSTDWGTESPRSWRLPREDAPGTPSTTTMSPTTFAGMMSTLASPLARRESVAKSPRQEDERSWAFQRKETQKQLLELCVQASGESGPSPRRGV